MAREITVRGSAVAAAQADYVELVLTVEAVRDTADEALTVVAGLSQTLTEILADLKVRKADRVTTAVSVREERVWEKEVYVSYGYKAQTSVQVRLPDARRLGALMQRSAGEAEAEIHGPWWRIDPGNAAYDAARRDAALEARRRAESYAEALGISLGAVTDIREPGVGERSFDEYPTALASASLAPEELSVHAGDLSVSAAVEVTFELHG